MESKVSIKQTNLILFVKQRNEKKDDIGQLKYKYLELIGSNDFCDAKRL